MIQTEMLLVMMRKMVPRLELMTDYYLQENCVTAEDDTKNEEADQEYQMWKAKMSHITRDAMTNCCSRSLSPLRWVDHQKEEIISCVKRTEEKLVQNAVTPLQTTVTSFSERLQNLLWELCWYLVILLANKVTGVKNMILDMVEYAVETADDVFEEKQKNRNYHQVTKSQSSNMVELDRDCETKYKESEQSANKIQGKNKFSFSDLDMKMFSLEQEIAEYEKSLLKCHQDIGENIAILLAGKNDKIEEEENIDKRKEDEEENMLEKPEVLTMTDYLLSLDTSCPLTDVPDEIVANIDMKAISFAGTTISTFQQLCDNQIQGRFLNSAMFSQLCARRWKSQHVVSWSKGERCVHYNQEITQDIESG